MIKILLALGILSVGAGGFLATHQSARRLQREANTAREVWITQTQLVTVAHSQKVELTGRLTELRRVLRQARPVEENLLWSSLQTNHGAQLSPELRERLLEELGFDWQLSPDFIVVTKQSLRDAGNWVFNDDRCSEVDAALLALTPEERAQVEAAMQRVRTDVSDWVLAHAERFGPNHDIIAKYLTPEPARLQTIKNDFATALVNALRRDRAELVRTSAMRWRDRIGAANFGYQTRMIIKREAAGDQLRLKAEISKFRPGETGPTPAGIQSGYLPDLKFPDAFRCTFPNGWADVARREGFELPDETKEK